ncbi:STY4851/ECs_5259 family protein [Roseivirga echinicomitans]
MYCRKWINDFLENRDIETFNGLPVYSYRMVDEEYTELRVALQLDIDNHNDLISHSFTAGLVLYCCEWWRREYQGSVWSWQPIFDSLDVQTPAHLLRTQIIERGFKRLKRPVIKTQKGENEYLGTIAFESGIPRSLLVDDHYFSKIITDGYLAFINLSSFELSELQIIEDICIKRRTPNVYRNKYFYQLILKLVDELINLNNRFDLRSLSNPVEFLNEKHPNWEHEFPIAPDSEVAVKFINQLLSDTSQNRDAVPLDRLKLKCRLVKSKDSYSVQRILNIEEGIIDRTDLGITKDEWINLSDVSEMYVENGEGNRRHLGSLYKISKDGKFNSGAFHNIILSKSILEYQKLTLEDPMSLKSIDLRIDSPNLIDNENPMFFSQNNDYWELKSVGSSRLKENTYRVLLKDGYQPSDFVSELNFSETGVKLFQIEAPCKFTDGATRFTISFTNKEQEIRYQVLPSSSHTIPFYPAKNKDIFLGMPRIYQINSDGVLLERIRQGIEYLNSHGEWKTLTDNIYGKLKIRKRDSAGTTLFNLSINLLPTEFRAEFVLGGERSQVVLYGVNKFDKAIETNLTTSIEGDIVVFKPSYENENEFFILRLYSTYSNTPVKVQLPIPKDITAFKGVDGIPIPGVNNVFVGGLFGKRFITNNLKSTRQRCVLTLTLHDPNILRQIVTNFYFDLEAFGTYEIPLITIKRRIQTLFSLTANNNSTVRLSYGKHTLIIRQFDSKPYFIDKSLFFKNPVKSVKAFRLDLPFVKSSEFIIELLVSDEGLLVDDSIIDGLWFIYPKKDSRDFFCPVVQNKTLNDELPESFSSLHEASLVKEFNDRQTVLIEILEELVSNPGSDQWRQLGELYEETEHMPMSTLDVWKAASKSNSVLASMFFIMSEKFIQRLTNEFSILWRAIRISEWDLAFKYYSNYINNLGLPASISQDIFFRKLESMNSIIGIMTVKSYLEKEDQPLIHQVYSHILKEELNGSQGNPGLRSRKVDQEWPDNLNIEVKLWLRSLPNEFNDIFQNVSAHQKAVVYLPVILAYSTINEEFILEELSDIQVRFLIEQIKSFDSEWFEKVFDFTQGYFLTKRMQNG